MLKSCTVALNLGCLSHVGMGIVKGGEKNKLSTIVLIFLTSGTANH